jgi:hypothetical protein
MAMVGSEQLHCNDGGDGLTAMVGSEQLQCNDGGDGQMAMVGITNREVTDDHRADPNTSDHANSIVTIEDCAEGGSLAVRGRLGDPHLGVGWSGETCAQVVSCRLWVDPEAEAMRQLPVMQCRVESGRDVLM